MSLLAFFGSGAPAVPEPWQPSSLFAVDVPGVPTEAPWHMSEPLFVPTYEGYNQVVHPSVVDFKEQWNGYRFWMVITPYPQDIEGVVADLHENPSIYASNDCLTWEPIGKQPLIPHPNGYKSGYNNDPEMVWNPWLRRLELWWNDTVNRTTWHSSSPDALNWSEWTKAGRSASMSQSIIPVAHNYWLLFARDHAGIVADGELLRVTAPSPMGPWSAPEVCTHTDGTSVVARGFWHLGVARDPETGKLFMATHSGNYIDLASSTDDGKSWTWNVGVIGRDADWVRHGLYRPFPVLHENGTHMRLWYSGRQNVTNGGHGWRLGYTELPLSLWP